MVPSIRVCWRIPPFPFIKRLSIITEYLEEPYLCAVETFPLNLLPVLQFPCLIRLRRRGAAPAKSYSEVCRDLSGCLSVLQVEQPCHKVDHIAVSTAGETMESPVQLHARVPVRMKRTDRHAIMVDPDSVTLCSCPSRDLILDRFKKIHVFIPFFSEAWSSLLAIFHPSAYYASPVIDFREITMIDIKSESLNDFPCQLFMVVISASLYQLADQFFVRKSRNVLHHYFLLQSVSPEQAESLPAFQLRDFGLEISHAASQALQFVLRAPEFLLLDIEVHRKVPCS